jgi:hypothetical protein
MCWNTESHVSWLASRERAHGLGTRRLYLPPPLSRTLSLSLSLSLSLHPPAPAPRSRPLLSHVRRLSLRVVPHNLHFGLFCLPIDFARYSCFRLRIIYRFVSLVLSRQMFALRICRCRSRLQYMTHSIFTRIMNYAPTTKLPDLQYMERYLAPLIFHLKYLVISIKVHHDLNYFKATSSLLSYRQLLTSITCNYKIYTYFILTYSVAY